MTARSTRYWRGLLGALAPLTKDGRKTKVEFLDETDTVEEMLNLLPSMIQTRKHLEYVEKTLKDVLRHMPSERREHLGWMVKERKAKELTPEALRVLHEALGDSFYEAISMSRTSLEKVAGESELELARQLELERVSSTTVVPIG